MSQEEYPYISECSVCGNGLLRLYQCDSCECVVAMCDECELIWIDVETVHKTPDSPSDGAFPLCPNCETTPESWCMLGSGDAADHDLDTFVAGTSV